MGMAGLRNQVKQPAKQAATTVAAPVPNALSATNVAEKGALNPGQRYGGGGRGHRTVITENWAKNPNNYTPPPIASNPGQGTQPAGSGPTFSNQANLQVGNRGVPIKLGAQVTRRRTLLGG